MIHPETRALLAYWQALRGGRPAPYRIEIDPRDMSCGAANLFVIEIAGDGAARFRLAGSAVNEAVGVDLRGHPAGTAMAAESAADFAALIADVLAGPAVGYARLTAERPPHEPWEVLLLPLRSEGGAMDRVLGLLHPLGGPPAGRTAAPVRFRIEEARREPVETGRAEARGMAEPPALFRAVGQSARLTSIDGGGRPGPGGAPRPRLRVIRDD